MTRVTTPFGFNSSADEVLAGVDLSGKNAIVTGGGSGIGLEIARSLARAGAAVTIAELPSFDAGRSVADIMQSTGSDSVSARHLDLGDLRSVRAFVEAWTAPVHILVNNAGIMAIPTLEKTPQGFEM